MTRAELINAMAEKSKLTSKQAADALTAFTETVTEALQDNQKLTLIGFGSFEIVERAARVGRNPKTGDELHIKASKSPKFKAGKALKDAVSGKCSKND
jgi:DNA-binding protein HU-beta